MRSTDGGANWSTFWPSLETGVNALLIDPTNTAVIYAGLETGFCKTGDGGATWQCNALQNISVTTLAMDPGDPSTLYAGKGSGLFLSKDGGANWTAASNGPAGTITSIVVAGPPRIGETPVRRPRVPGGRDRRFLSWSRSAGGHARA